MVIRLFQAALIVILLAPAAARAGSFDLSGTLLGQFRETTGNRREVPMNGYLGLGFSQEKWDFETRADMRIYRDLSQGLDDYDLYDASLHLQPVPALQIDFGRQFLSEGFSAGVIDGLKVGLQPAAHLEVVTYTGIPRSVERGDFNRDDGLTAGIALGLTGFPQTKVRLSGRWDRTDLNTTDFRENDRVRVGLQMSQLWEGEMRPLVYSLFEFDAAGKVVETATAGFDLSPSRRIALTIEMNYFDIDREAGSPTIFSLFSRGPMLAPRFASTWTLIPGRIDLIQSYTYQNLEVEPEERRHAHRLDLGPALTFDRIGLSLFPAYSFATSFGGTLHGGRIGIHEVWFERLWSDLSFDYTRYTKVTSDNDIALSTVLETGFQILKGWNLTGGFEYNRNNLLQSDVRGTIKLEYRHDWKT